MFDIFQYAFALRALEAGVCIALIAPLIGMFLVLRRYSLIADTLSHVSLAGVSIGLLTGLNPLMTALVTSGGSALLMEHLRVKRRAYGDTALSLFLSGSLAIAIVLMSVGKGLNTAVFSYLFGSIVTVRTVDLLTIGIVGIGVVGFVLMYYRELVSISFDEEAAIVSGLPVARLNRLFVVVASSAIVLSIPIVGVLLISALMIIPVVTALQWKKGFTATLIIAEVISLVSTVGGIFLSFLLNTASGGTIVLLMLLIFGMVVFIQKK